MTYRVELLEEALEDILSIVGYYQAHAGTSVATQIYQEINEAVQSLADMPQRGHIPHELWHIATTDIFEIVAGHYRLIYQCSNQDVTIFAVLDGRQDVRTHLNKRRMRLKL